jgi:predicted patatin/cPLA2 family phospholipase
VFLFNSSNLSNYIDFLKYIKRRNYLHVNVIYYNNGTEKLIYNIDKNKKDIIKNKIEKKDTSDTNFIKEIITPLL